MKHSYVNKEEVILLLNDVSDVAIPVSLEERERRVKAGERTRSIIIEEYAISDEYRNIVLDNMEEYLQNMANSVCSLAEQLYAVKGKDLVLVDIVRAGIPIGILVRRYLKNKYDVVVPHYGISLVRGLDKKAMEYIMSKHGKKGIQFIDGWTGRGTVTRDILKSVESDFEGVDGSLAVLSDSINVAKYAGTREDIYIPHAPLNAAATGLVSITVKNDEYENETGFNSAMYLDNLESVDISDSYLDRVEKLFIYDGSYETLQNTGVTDSELGRISEVVNRQIRLMNPGINEAARAVLRRELEKLLVSSLDDRDVRVLIELAKLKGVPTEVVELNGYKAVSVADDGYLT